MAGPQIICFEHRCVSDSQVSCLVWYYLISSIGCCNWNMFLHRAQFLFRSFSPWVPKTMRAWLPPSDPYPRAHSELAGLPLTLCRRNMVSKTPAFTRSSKVSRVTGSLNQRAMTGGRIQPTAAPSSATCPSELTTGSHLAVHDKAHNSDSETQESKDQGSPMIA